MPRKGIASIGVDFGAREVRAVEVSPDGRTIKRFASNLLPSIGLDKGVPSDANVVADVFKGVMRDLNPATKPCVIGIPALAVTTRVLDIPQVPETELRAILDGEVQHFGIVRGFGGMFDFVRLQRLEAEKDSDPQALVMACEAVQLNALRDGAERARMTKSAMEPSMLGLIRLAAMHHGSASPTLLVAVCGDIAEIAISVDHRLRLYRRLELADATPDETFLRGMAIADDDAVPAFLKPEAGSGTANQLVLELKRTIEYVKREFAAAGVIDHVVLAVSSPKEAPLEQVLSEGLDIDVEIAKAPLPGDDGFKYAAAYGLAMGSAFPDLGIPMFDLSPYDPVEEANNRQQKILATSMIASILIVLASVGGGLFYGKQAADVQHNLTHDKEQLAELQKQALPEAMARQAKLEAYRTLSTYGVPVPQVVDALMSTLDSRTGLTGIDIAANQIKLDGESADEASMIQTLDQIRVKPGFRGASIESFDQQGGDNRKVVKFRMSATLGGSPRP